VFWIGVALVALVVVMAVREKRICPKCSGILVEDHFAGKLFCPRCKWSEK
jgi:ribosomal protein S27AE